MMIYLHRCLAGADPGGALGAEAPPLHNYLGFT